MRTSTSNNSKTTTTAPLNGLPVTDNIQDRPASTLVTLDLEIEAPQPTVALARTAVDSKKKTKPDKLSEREKESLAKYEETIRGYGRDQARDFYKLAEACFRIQRDELYRPYTTEAAYFMAKFGFKRAHPLRLAKMGRLLDRLSPAGDTVKMLASDAHVRPLLGLTDEQQDAVIRKTQSWGKMANLVNVPAKLLTAARTFLNPSVQHEPKDSAQAKLAAQFREAVERVQAKLAPGTSDDVLKAFDTLKKEAAKIGNAGRRSTGIEWTEHTWNPLHGCTRCSKGCDRCYAAKMTATRLADLYPGLAVKKESADGTITYAFTGKIQLSPQDLADPLHDQIPKMIFVNSMSDLFHTGVPEAFIEDIFTVMELAHWHTFQVLTKRPERMAAFTQKRYADKQPPKNVWLGTSTEDQSTFDERMPHLKNTKAAVRWLSAEPLLGPIEFGSMEGISWIVVGGESGPNARPMSKPWATGIRDACQRAGIPFFFKQWGSFNEHGAKEREQAGPSKLDGKVHHEYPEI